MQRVKGIFDGTHVNLLERVTIPPDTEVEVLIPDAEEQQTQAVLQRLLDLGIIKEIHQPLDNGEPFEPIPNPGEPISDTIIRERR